MMTGLLLAGVTPAFANTGFEEAPVEVELVPEVTEAVDENGGSTDAGLDSAASELTEEAETADSASTGATAAAGETSDEGDAVDEDLAAVGEDAQDSAPEVYGEAGPPASWNGTISGKILDPKKVVRPGEKLVVVAFEGRKIRDFDNVVGFVENINGATSFTIKNLPRRSNITLIVTAASLDLSRFAEFGWTSAPGSAGTYEASKLGYIDLKSTKNVTGIELTMKPGFADMCMIFEYCNKFYKEIMWMYDTGLSTGVRFISSGDGNTTQHYRPKDTVTREAMAAFLYRLNTPKGARGPAGYTVPSRTPFADVPTNHKFFKEIAWMHKSGLSTGIKRGGQVVYAPKSGVSREAMAAFMFRMEKPNYKVTNKPYFGDVPRGHKFFKQIQWMYDSGLSTGVKRGSGVVFLDQARVSREAMAAFLYRAEH